MSEDSVNRTNVTNDINITITELNKTLPEKITEESLFVLDSASLIGIFIAFAVVLLTLGELTYGCRCTSHGISTNKSIAAVNTATLGLKC